MSLQTHCWPCTALQRSRKPNYLLHLAKSLCSTPHRLPADSCHGLANPLIQIKSKTVGTTLFPHRREICAALPEKSPMGPVRQSSFLSQPNMYGRAALRTAEIFMIASTHSALDPQPQ